MNTKFGWENIGKIFLVFIGVISSAILTAISLTSNPPTFGAWNKVGTPIAGGLVVIGLCWHIVNLQSTLNDRTPNIDITGDLTPHDVNMGNTINGAFIPYAISNMAGVAFANNPKHRTDNNHAKGVRAEITYLDSQRNVLFGPIQARWGETLQPSEISRGQLPSIESVELPNNGGIRSIVVLFKYPEDDHCYAFDNNSYNYGPTFKNPDYEIKAKRFIIRVILKGAYIPEKPWEFEVETAGKGDTYKIRYGEEWHKTENSHATIQLPPTTRHQVFP